MSGLLLIKDLTFASVTPTKLAGVWALTIFEMLSIMRFILGSGMILPPIALFPASSQATSYPCEPPVSGLAIQQLPTCKDQ